MFYFLSIKLIFIRESLISIDKEFLEFDVSKEHYNQPLLRGKPQTKIFVKNISDKCIVIRVS